MRAPVLPGVVYLAIVAVRRPPCGYRGAVVTPALYAAGPTPARSGSGNIPVYGIRPYPESASDLERMHGTEDRVSIRWLNEGTDVVERILRSVATR